MNSSIPPGPTPEATTENEQITYRLAAMLAESDGQIREFETSGGVRRRYVDEALTILTKPIAKPIGPPLHLVPAA